MSNEEPELFEDDSNVVDNKNKLNLINNDLEENKDLDDDDDDYDDDEDDVGSVAESEVDDESKNDNSIFENELDEFLENMSIPDKNKKKKKPKSKTVEEEEDDEENINDVENEDNEDDEDVNEEDDENYFKKLDENIKKNIILDYHPELIQHNYEEIDALSKIVRNDQGVIIDPLHRTLPFITKYEKARILGDRAKQINAGSKPYVKIEPFMIDGYIIALKEFEEKRIPFIIKRPLPNGGCEYWKLKDLEILI